MISFAYGASINDNNSNITESIHPASLYIKTTNCSKDIATNRITLYHRKCLQLAIDTNRIDDYDKNRHRPIEIILEDLINSFYKIFATDVSITILSSFIDDNLYLKHHITLSKRQIITSLFMAL